MERKPRSVSDKRTEEDLSGAHNKIPVSHHSCAEGVSHRSRRSWSASNRIDPGEDSRTVRTFPPLLLVIRFPEEIVFCGRVNENLRESWLSSSCEMVAQTRDRPCDLTRFLQGHRYFSFC